MDEYRFVIQQDGRVQNSNLVFQKGAYERYLELNGLTEGNIMDSYTDWADLLGGNIDELVNDGVDWPLPLPEKYSGNIFVELEMIRKDVACFGLAFFDPDPVFDDCSGMLLDWVDNADESHDLSCAEVCEVYARLGYNVESVILDGHACFAIRELPEEDDDEEDEEYLCPDCGAILDDQPGFDTGPGTWTCRKCGKLLMDEDVYEGDIHKGVAWFCDQCGELMNRQKGFTDTLDTWICTSCAHTNKIASSKIICEDLS